MVLEFFDSLSQMEIVGGLTVLSLLIGGVIMAIGVIVARTVRVMFNKYYAASLTQDSAKNISKLLYYGIMIISFLIFTSSTGLDLSGLLVAGGIFAVVIGFATQSVVSNLISGIFLMMEKPAKQGDSIELPDMGISGTLVDISTFSSRVRKFDGTLVRIPNEKFFTSNIRSLSSSPVRRAEATVGIAYSEKVEHAIREIENEIRDFMPFVLQVPKPEFRVDELADSSVNITILVWHPRENWGEVQPILLKHAKLALDKAGIEIPFPQRVIWQGKE